MESHRSRPTLMFHLGGPAVLRIVQRGLLGGIKVRMEDFMQVSAALYATGAVLGRAISNRIEILARMFSEPGSERQVSQFIQSEAAARIHNCGREPDNFPELFLTTEWQEVGVSWPDDYRSVMRLGNKKVSLDKVEDKIKLYVLEGIGFGAAFPEKTERMWRNLYETVDVAAWQRARSYGVDAPEEPTPVLLEDREQEVLLQVAEYATQYYPALVEPLGLRISLRVREE